ncbi:MAG TPA: hypothetical protein VK843_10120 [Planctomycetota bacterium]|nr:hypothetical protein [Planctomycetota bacterium]
MSWGLSIVVGLVTGVLGALCGGVVTALVCHWHQVSTREGERAYMVLFGGLLGIVIGVVVGIVTSRTVAEDPSAGFLKAFGYSAGASLALSLLVLGFAFVSAPPAPVRVEEETDSTPKSKPAPPEEPEEDYGTQRMRELRAFKADTPLGVWIGYTRGNDSPAVKEFAKRAIATRPALHEDLCALLDSQRCSEALVYILEEIPGAPDDLGEGIRAALRQVPELLRQSFDDSSGVHADSGLYDVRLALSAAERFTTPSRSFAPEVAEIARCFEVAPRVRRISRRSGFVEEKIKEFDAERLLAAWMKKKR